MKILEYILDEVKRTEVNYVTNIIIQYQDLEGENFFEKMEFLRFVLNILREENNICLVEDNVIPMKQWEWDLPIYFDSKYKFLQFDLERMEEDDLSPEEELTVECGSIWRRPVDGTIIEVQGIESDLIYTKLLGGPGLVNETLNHSVLRLFWDKKK